MTSFWDRVEDEVTPSEARVPLCLRGDLTSRLAGLREQHLAALQYDAANNVTPTAPAVAREIDDLQAQIAEHTTVFVLRALGDRGWRDLLRKHPPAKDDQRAGAQYNPDTFPAAALAATIVEPAGVTLDGVQTLLARVTPGDANRLWQACLGLHYEVHEVGESVRSTEPAPPSGTSSTTAHPEESPTASS